MPKSLTAVYFTDARQAGVGIDLDFGDVTRRSGMCREPARSHVSTSSEAGTPSGSFMPARRRCASSMMPIARSVPAMTKRPLLNSMSPADASSTCAAICLPFSIDFVGSLHDGGAAQHRRARAAGAAAGDELVAVALQQT